MLPLERHTEGWANTGGLVFETCLLVIHDPFQLSLAQADCCDKLRCCCSDCDKVFARAVAYPWGSANSHSDPENLCSRYIAVLCNMQEQSPLHGRGCEDESECSADVAGDLYDEVEPTMILETRKGEGPKKREFLVKFGDGHEDCWLPERDIAQDIIDDFDAGRELAEAECILEQRLRGDTIDYLVR